MCCSCVGKVRIIYTGDFLKRGSAVKGLIIEIDFFLTGLLELSELKKSNLSHINTYVQHLRDDVTRLRNVSYEGAWVWADEDDMLKYEGNGYFEKYHHR